MRIEKSVTSITWIPSEAISGMPKVPFEMGVAHYDDPPPDKLEDSRRFARRTPSARRTSCAHGSSSKTDGRRSTATPAAAISESPG